MDLEAIKKIEYERGIAAGQNIAFEEAKEYLGFIMSILTDKQLQQVIDKGYELTGRK